MLSYQRVNHTRFLGWWAPREINGEDSAAEVLNHCGFTGKWVMRLNISEHSTGLAIHLLSMTAGFSSHVFFSSYHGCFSTTRSWSYPHDYWMLNGCPHFFVRKAPMTRCDWWKVADFTRSDGNFATEPTPEIGLPGALGVLAEFRRGED